MDLMRDFDYEQTNQSRILSQLLFPAKSVLSYFCFKKTELEKNLDAFVIMYSVIDKASFQRAEEYLERLHDQDFHRGKSTILVGNKVDLVRSRVVSSQGWYIYYYDSKKFPKWFSTRSLTRNATKANALLVYIILKIFSKRDINIPQTRKTVSAI